MKIVFVSNYYNHHQAALCRALDNFAQNFYFVATAEMRKERRELGYGNWDIPRFVVTTFEEKEAKKKCEAAISDSDVVIVGSAPESLVATHVKKGKLTFRYSERPLKEKLGFLRRLKRYVVWHMRNPRNKEVYLLCAGAYVAYDYSKLGLFDGRAYKWGYFPETKNYENIDSLVSKKSKKQILWVGRLIPLKHPENALMLAKRMKDSGYSFSLKMIGTGIMEDSLRRMIKELEIEDVVTMLGSMTPERVREYMEKSGIFLATADRNEGWGAVINEAMNSGCAVVCNAEIGSVPYLIENEKNGLVYKSFDIDNLYEKVIALIEQPDLQYRVGKEAYLTIINEWNAEVAAERLMRLSEAILSGDKTPDLYKSGPCSRAELIKD